MDIDFNVSRLNMLPKISWNDGKLKMHFDNPKNCQGYDVLSYYTTFIDTMFVCFPSGNIERKISIHSSDQYEVTVVNIDH